MCASDSVTVWAMTSSPVSPVKTEGFDDSRSRLRQRFRLLKLSPLRFLDRDCWRHAVLVSCPINNMAFVAIKMGRRSGSCRTRGGRISESIRNQSRGRGTAAGPFSSQPSGPWPVGCFSSAAPDHSSRINSDTLVASASAARTALKNSQLIRPLPDESHVIYGAGHKTIIACGELFVVLSGEFGVRTG